MLVDPRGYVIAQASGEGHGPELSALVDELVAEYGAALRRGPLFAAGEGEESHLPDATGHEGGFPGTPGPGGGALRYPGKALRLPDGALLVSDTGHHRLVELEPDLASVRRTIGAGHGAAGDR